MCRTKRVRFHRGKLEAGRPMATGWGTWQMEVAQVMPQADAAPPSSSQSPRELGCARQTGRISRVASRCSSRRGAEHDEEWLASGWSVDLPGDRRDVAGDVWPQDFSAADQPRVEGFRGRAQRGQRFPGRVSRARSWSATPAGDSPSAPAP